MLKLRLQRVGRKNDPSFRVVVTESQNGPQSGKFLEILGAYDARQGKPQLNADRIKHWIEKGAQTSSTVNNMLVRFGVVEGKTVNNLPKMVAVEPKVVEAAPAAVAAAPAAPEVEMVTEDTAPEEPKEEVPVETTPAPVEEEADTKPSETE